MLQELHVKNLALIEEAGIEFGEGLHILTGETGAGKSLLLDSLSLALGQKASADLIGRYSDSTVSELIFGIDDPQIISRLREMDVPLEDGQLILSRRISAKGSTCRINGETFPASKVKEVASLLIDIHGQHEHQSLLKKSNHIRLLDDFAGTNLLDIKNRISKVYKEYKDLIAEIEAEDMDTAKRDRELALIRYELEEIQNAELSPHEDDILEAEFAKMSNAKKLSDEASALGENADEICNLAGDAIKRLTEMSSVDESLSDMLSLLIDAEDMLTGFRRSIKTYAQGIDINEQRTYETEQRLNLINHLKTRYGKSVEDILLYMDELVEKQEKYENHDLHMEKLKNELMRVEKELEQLCEKASELRYAAADSLSNVMKEALLELNFLQGDFKVNIVRSSEYSSAGFDDVEFLISTNPGQPLKSLSQIASGGELSRIMLAIRTACACRDGIGTLIFDEIDTGISGRTATQVAGKLSELSRNCQVICITHLPQLAAYADRHYLIEKSTDGSDTTTSVEELLGEASFEELTRLLGDTKSALDTAHELKEKALEHKSKMSEI